MPKKKKSHRKTNFSYSQPANRANQSGPVAVTEKSEPKPEARPASVEVVSLKVVRADLKQVFKLAIGFILLELILWYVLQHTGFGAQIYGHFK